MVKRNSNSYRNYGYDREIVSFSNVNYNIAYPTYYNLRGTNYIPHNFSIDELVDKFVSLYTSFNYSFKDRFSVSASARKDASNLFGVKTNDRWKPLWSVGGAWNIHNESFFPTSKISILKFRYTYGFSGNVNNSRAAVVTIQQQNPSSSSLNGLPFARINNRPDPSLRWETVRTSNFGIDFRSHLDRISASLDIYSKRSFDLISLIPADVTTTGNSEIAKNSAILKGTGVDLSLSVLVIKKPLEWKATVLMSQNRTKVVKYLKAVSAPASHAGSTGLTPINGELAYNVITFKWAGLDPVNGNPRGYLGGEISDNYAQIISQASWDDIEIHGSAIPLMFGSLRNDVAFKGFSISFNISYRLGYYYRRGSINYSSLYSSWRGHADFKRRWQAPGDELTTNVPSMVYPQNARRDNFYSQSSSLVDRADNIKLSDLRIAYDLDRIFHRTLTKCQVYLYARDIGFIWRKNKLKDDPDTSTGVSSPASYSGGIRFTF